MSIQEQIEKVKHLTLHYLYGPLWFTEFMDGEIKKRIEVVYFNLDGILRITFKENDEIVEQLEYEAYGWWIMDWMLIIGNKRVFYVRFCDNNYMRFGECKSPQLGDVLWEHEFKYQ